MTELSTKQVRAIEKYVNRQVHLWKITNLTGAVAKWFATLLVTKRHWATNMQTGDQANRLVNIGYYLLTCLALGVREDVGIVYLSDEALSGLTSVLPDVFICVGKIPHTWGKCVTRRGHTISSSMERTKLQSEVYTVYEERTVHMNVSIVSLSARLPLQNIQKEKNRNQDYDEVATRHHETMRSLPLL